VIAGTEFQMRALYFDQQLAYRADYPDPRPAPGESIVRVALAGICGTDLEISRGYMAMRGVPGHEFVGRVTETEDPRLRAMRVVGEINAACGRCRACVEGMGRHCPERTVLGIVGRDGAFAEFLRLPNENLLIVPDSVTDQAAVFAEPLAAAYEILEQLYLGRNRSIAVLGDGRLGALVAMMLRGEGYLPTVLGRHRDKLDRLAALGLDAREESSLNAKFDCVIDCTGRSTGLARALDLVRPRGTIVLKSTAAAGAQMNLAPVVVNEITVLGSRCGRFGPALDALASGKVDPRPLISATFALEDGNAALEAASAAPNFKILLRPS
jgi:threonine dehydrogenase-like Zn-dependent dehydrogenase